MGFDELLGSTLLGPGMEKQNTTEALNGKKAVALYFSANFCLLNKWTPRLVYWYKQGLKAKGLEVVYVPCCNEQEASFMGHFREMPWLAVDFKDTEVLAKLQKKFKVAPLPSLIILDSNGKLTTENGLLAVGGDPWGHKMPWIPPKPKDLVEKMTLTSPAGTVTLSEAMKGKKALALYFSANWCPPWRGFTSQLAKWYSQNLKAKGLEVIFVSSDRDEASFMKCFGEMPWLALDFSERALGGELSSTLKLPEIPALVILDSDFNVVTMQGRKAVAGDPLGNELPWYPKAVGNLMQAGPGDIKKVPTLLAFCETCDDAEKQELEEHMTVVAKKFLPDMAFFMCKSNCFLGGTLRWMFGMATLPPAPHVHELLKKDMPGGWACDGCGQDCTGKNWYRCAEGCDFDLCGDCHSISGKKFEKRPVQMVILDIPSDGAYYMAKPAPVTLDSVQGFVKDFMAGSLEKQQLSLTGICSKGLFKWLGKKV